MADQFEKNARRLATRFLRTAVVIDDAAYMTSAGRNEEPHGNLATPTPHSPAPADDFADQAKIEDIHSLDAKSIMDSFWALGVICSVTNPIDAEIEAARKADIVILDWLLKDDDSEYTLALLRKLLKDESEQHSLRLVNIYTGEAQLSKIGEEIFSELEKLKLEPKQSDGLNVSISYQHGQVELYAKDHVNLSSQLIDRKISEKDLPSRLVDRFADMTSGLIPSIALNSLISIRESEHKLLNQFNSKLDPAYLTHVSCLADPIEAEQHIVAQVAEEIRGLISASVAEESPAGEQAIKNWIRQDKRFDFKFGDDKILNIDETIELVTFGKTISNSKISKNWINKNFEKLTSGFAWVENIDGVDEQLAWMMSFRTVHNQPPPTLWSGTVVTFTSNDEERHMVCLRPRCDSVRLSDSEPTRFIFLPLVNSGKQCKNLLVVKINNKFKKLSIDFDTGSLVRKKFKPLERQRIVARRCRTSNGNFVFSDIKDRRYIWRGELKPEYSLRLARKFADRLSRIGLDESEWIRRQSKG